jgi:response regulator RpfG family c-di-GMP phosphodiesterase
MKGDIGVQSAKGEGSVFRVELHFAAASSVAPALIEFSAVALASIPVSKQIPVIAISANAMPRHVERYLAAGFFGYLAKPIHIVELMETLNSALDSSLGR